MPLLLECVIGFILGQGIGVRIQRCAIATPAVEPPNVSPLIHTVECGGRLSLTT